MEKFFLVLLSMSNFTNPMESNDAIQEKTLTFFTHVIEEAAAQDTIFTKVFFAQQLNPKAFRDKNTKQALQKMIEDFNTQNSNLEHTKGQVIASLAENKTNQEKKSMYVTLQGIESNKKIIFKKIMATQMILNLVEIANSNLQIEHYKTTSQNLEYRFPCIFSSQIGPVIFRLSDTI